MNILTRVARHIRITWKNYAPDANPPFLILFITSTCNQKCEHCFYWRHLNRKDDLSKEELFALSRSLGRVEHLSLSGGEPFLHSAFSDVCRQFVRRNKVRQIYVPTNGTYTERTLAHVRATLQEAALEMFVVELSLDGMPVFHDRFRGVPGVFSKAMETYDALAEVQQADPRLRIHAISTATTANMKEIGQLSAFLLQRCKHMDHHNLAIIRGDRKNPSLDAPDLEEYRRLYAHIRTLWKGREQGRYGAIVEPMLQWAKIRTAAANKQVIPCRAGILSAVVYANGDVSVCESRVPLGNLRTRTFRDIWNSPLAQEVRKSIARKQCHCTNEVFLWPSIVHQPVELGRALLGSRGWQWAQED